MNANNFQGYNPRRYLTDMRPTSVSRWQRKKPPIMQLLYPENYVIPLRTAVSEPNPYFDRKWVGMYSREEWGRLGQDINWNTLGTKGG